MPLIPRRALLGALLATLAATSGASRARADGDAVETTVLAKVGGNPEGVDGQSLRVAPQGAHVAWRAEKEGTWAWVIDGKPGTRYADVGPLAFSDDGQHWVYFARAGDKTVLVWDAAETPVDGLAPAEGTLRFVPGGTRVAFVARQTPAEEGAPTSTVVVVDGTPGPAFSDVRVETLVFTADGKRHAYVAADGENEVVVVDGTAGARHPRGAVGAPRFSADGTRVAYEVKKPEARVFVDGVPGPVFDRVMPPTFAPKGARMWHVAVRKGKPLVVVDGKEDPPVLDVLAPGPVWSPDGTRLGYVAIRADGKRVVIDGEAGPVFPRIGADSLRFSADGKRHAYWAGKSSKPFWVVDGVPGPEVDLVGKGDSFAFSPDAKRYAFSAQSMGKWVVLVGTASAPKDGATDVALEEGPPTDGLGKGYPVFSPDSAHVVYEAVVGKSWHVFVDQNAGPAFDGISEHTLAFGRDGATVGFVANHGRTGTIVIDGLKASGGYPAMLPGSTLLADGPRSFHAWFATEEGFVHVRAELKPAAPR